MQQLPSDEDLLKQYLAICHQSVEQNRSRFPYGEIFKSLDCVRQRDIQVCVIDNHPVTTFALSYHPSGSWQTKRLRQGKPSEPPVWTVRREYLQQVIDDADTYVGSPARLDWDWLAYATEDDGISLHGNSDEQAEHA